METRQKCSVVETTTPIQKRNVLVKKGVLIRSITVTEEDGTDKFQKIIR